MAVAMVDVRVMADERHEMFRVTGRLRLCQLVRGKGQGARGKGQGTAESNFVGVGFPQVSP
jgi:hypothetical protein